MCAPGPELGLSQPPVPVQFTLRDLSSGQKELVAGAGMWGCSRRVGAPFRRQGAHSPEAAGNLWPTAGPQAEAKPRARMTPVVGVGLHPSFGAEPGPCCEASCGVCGVSIRPFSWSWDLGT